MKKYSELYFDTHKEAALSYFEQILNEYDNLIPDLFYEIKFLSENERIIIIQDRFILYATVRHAFPDDPYRYRMKCPVETIHKQYEVYFEELFFNELFKFSFAELKRNTKNIPVLLNYERFNSSLILDREEFPDRYEKTNFFKVNQLLPALQLEERFDSWEGVLYNYVIFEYKEKDKTGYASFYTRVAVPEQEADKREQQLEQGLIQTYAYPKGSSIDGLYDFEGIVFSKSFVEISKEIIDYEKKHNWKDQARVGNRISFLSDKLSYFIIPKYIKRFDNDITLQNLKRTVIKEALEGGYDKIERIRFDLSERPLTPSQKLFNLIYKMFPKDEVIYHCPASFFEFNQENQKIFFDAVINKQRIAFVYGCTPDKFVKLNELCYKHYYCLIYISSNDELNKKFIEEKIKEAKESLALKRKPVIRVASAVIPVKTDDSSISYLFLQTTEKIKHNWVFPRTTFSESENMKSVLQQHLHEAHNLLVFPKELLNLYYYETDSAYYLHYVVMCYPSEPLGIPKPDEFKDCKFMTWDEMQKEKMGFIELDTVKSLIRKEE